MFLQSDEPSAPAAAAVVWRARSYRCMLPSNSADADEFAHVLSNNGIHVAYKVELKCPILCPSPVISLSSKAVKGLCSIWDRVARLMCLHVSAGLSTNACFYFCQCPVTSHCIVRERRGFTSNAMSRIHRRISGLVYLFDVSPLLRNHVYFDCGLNQNQPTKPKCNGWKTKYSLNCFHRH